ncbi:MAG: acyl-CoA dehydrogenase [Actinomycetota bacterium]|nr:acyl-CoA dehydrogenase [Actinomycetota bacterium]
MTGAPPPDEPPTLTADEPPTLTADDIGVAAVTESPLSAEQAWRVAALLDRDDEPSSLAEGDALPLLWHWAFFAPVVPTTRLGADGHPRLAEGGPTSGLPRRMWAGGRVTMDGALVVGRPATRRSEVVSAERKTGRSGDLLVVTARHRIEQDGRVLLTEEQDLVYRAHPAPAPGATVAEAPAGEVRPDAPDGGWADTYVAGPLTLFRYSAATWNSHRIHYDRPYAMTEEGYPGLVVHGPLTATLLVESARRRGVAGRSFSFRAAAPLFAEIPFTLVGRPDGEGTELTAVRNDGTVAMTARLD